MKLEKKTEKALLMGAALLFTLLILIAVALMLSPGEEESAPSTPAPTAAPTVLPQDGYTIGGKLTAKDADTFYLHKTVLSDSDRALLSSLSSLRTLSLTGCVLTDVSFLTPLSGLTTLYLSDNTITDLTPLSSLSSLRTLYLDNNPVSELTPLYALSSLETLSLQGISLQVSELSALQAALPGCKIFDDAISGSARPLMLGGLSFTVESRELYLSSRGISDISILSECSGVQILDLSGNPLEGIGVLKQLTALHTLNLASTGLTDSDLRIVMGMRSLRWLNVTGNDQLSGEALDELDAALSGCQIIHDEPSYKIKLGSETLRSDIDTLSMPSARLVSISPLRKCTQLQSADLSHNYLSDLTPLSACTELISMNLEDNRITTCEGLFPLVMLQTLDLSDNRITDVSALGGCLNLTTLDLSNNNLGYVSPLYTCINLRHLDLRGNPLTWEAVEALRAALPLCEILTDAVPTVPDFPVLDPVIVQPDVYIPEG